MLYGGFGQALRLSNPRAWGGAKNENPRQCCNYVRKEGKAEESLGGGWGSTSREISLQEPWEVLGNYRAALGKL